MSHESGIPYLPYEEFTKRYPITNKTLLGEGASGIIYESGNYAIKRFNKLAPLVSELNMYSLLTHPCILKPLFWSHTFMEGYLVMERGHSIFEAYKHKKITIEEIVSDTVSAIAFMNAHGFVHCDIKPPNMIYSRGRIKIIDMDLSQKASLKEGKYYTTGVSYTYGFIDPEYFDKQWNDISSEIYALCVSYHVIVFGGRFPDKGNLYHFRTGITNVDSFLEKALVLQDVRPLIQTLLNTSELIVRRYEGSIYTPPRINNTDRHTNGDLKALFEWMINIQMKSSLEVKILFLALSLAYRCFSKVIEPGEDVNLFGTTCIDLVIYASLIHQETAHVNKTMAFKIMRAAECIIITPTYWDIARSKEDLLVAVDAMINCRPFTTGDSATNDKNITVGQLRRLKNKHPIEEKKTEEMSVSYFKELLTQHDYNFQSQLNLILHNRKILPKLPEELAFDVYILLTDVKEYAYEILDIVCKFNWREYNIDRLSQILDAHPFTSTQEELTRSENDLNKQIRDLETENDRLRKELEILKT